MFRLVLLTLCCVAMVISIENTGSEKRLVLHSDDDVAAAFQAVSAQLHSLNATVENLKSTVQSKDSTIEALQTTMQLLHSAIQHRDNTVHSLNASVQSLTSTVQSLEARDSTIEFLQSTIQSTQTTMQSVQTTLQSVQTTDQTRDTSIQALQHTVQSMETTVESLDTKLTTGVSSTYIRWGRTVCPGNGTQLVYKGFAGGSMYNVKGGAADYLCLTQDPLWGQYEDTASSYGLKVYGAEYQFGQQFSDGGEALFGQDMYEHDVPCAVCRPPRAVTIMIPGRNECYPGWNFEYAGYLVSGHATFEAASNYACVDNRPEVEFGDNANDNGKLMWVTEAACGSLKCPPYVENRELTCVVCSI